MWAKEWRVVRVAEWSQRPRGSTKHCDRCLTSVTLMRSQSPWLSTFSTWLGSVLACGGVPGSPLGDAPNLPGSCLPLQFPVQTHS